MELIDKAALVAEIERRMKIAEKRLDINNSYSEEGNAAWERDKALYDAYNSLLSFLNTLEVKEVQEEPVCEDLEVEVDRWYNNEAPKEFEDVVYADIEKCAKHFADWQKQQDQSTIELAEDHAMLAGMEKMKEQMMAKAIEAVVSQVPCSNEIILYNPSSVDKYYLPQEMNKLGLNKGDKVKLVIIKED